MPIPDLVDGVLLIGSEVERVDAFDTRDLPLASAQAAQIGSLIENERQMASISELRDLMRRLVQLQHASLTGLLNRSAFARAARQVIDAKGVNGQRWAVAIIDLNDCKNVNDSFGHGDGGAMPVTIGRRIKASITSTESVAHLSGDESAVPLKSRRPPGTLEHHGTGLLDAIREPMFLASGAKPAPEPMMGIGVASDGDDLATLLDRADQAMYRAKAGGKEAVKLIEPQHASMKRHSASDALDQTARFPNFSIVINLGLTQLSRNSFAEVVRRQTAPVHLGRLALEIPIRALRRSPEAAQHQAGHRSLKA